MKQYQVDLYKDNVLMRSTNLTINEIPLTLEEAASRARTLLLVAGYDKEYDSIRVVDMSDVSHAVFTDLVED